MGKNVAQRFPPWTPSSQDQEQMKNIVIPVKSSQILNWITHPVLLIPQPGKGYAWIMTEVVTVVQSGGVPYANGSNVDRYYGTVTPSFHKHIIHKDTIQTVTKAFCCHNAELADEDNQLPSLIDNQAIYCAPVGVAYTAGNGGLIISALVIRVKLF